MFGHPVGSMGACSDPGCPRDQAGRKTPTHMRAIDFYSSVILMLMEVIGPIHV